jgi:hypothetical protein
MDGHATMALQESASYLSTSWSTLSQRPGLLYADQQCNASKQLVAAVELGVTICTKWEGLQCSGFAGLGLLILLLVFL